MSLRTEFETFIQALVLELKWVESLLTFLVVIFINADCYGVG